MSGRDRIMYRVAQLKPFKLKTTNGNRLCYYGNCNINIDGIQFDNMKNRNKTEKPFNIYIDYDELSPLENNNAVKLSATTHILAIQQKYVIENTFKNTGITTSNTNYNTETILTIPNFSVEATFNAFNNFINSIKNPQIRKPLQMILYNVTHGDTPYSNTEYMNVDVENNFTLCNGDGDYPFMHLDYPYITGRNNYAQNAIILIAQTIYNATNTLEYPWFYYQTDNLCRDIRTIDNYYTMPSYGIAPTNINENSTGIIYFYWTTYKGV